LTFSRPNPFFQQPWRCSLEQSLIHLFEPHPFIRTPCILPGQQHRTNSSHIATGMVRAPQQDHSHSGVCLPCIYMYSADGSCLHASTCNFFQGLPLNSYLHTYLIHTQTTRKFFHRLSFFRADDCDSTSVPISGRGHCTHYAKFHEVTLNHGDYADPFTYKYVMQERHPQRFYP
jgi:hypothetical protein